MAHKQHRGSAEVPANDNQETLTPVTMGSVKDSHDIVSSLQKVCVRIIFIF